MKSIKVLLLGLTLSLLATSAVAEVSFGTTTSRAVTFTDVNRVTTGTIDNREIKYSTQRGVEDVGSRNCGAGCSPADHRYVVDTKFGVTDTKTLISEKTTGTSNSDTTSCFTTLTAGNLNHSVGASETNASSDTTTQRNNVSTIKGYEVSVSTINDKDHGGLGVGDDVTVKSGNQVLFDTAGNFNSNVNVLNTKDVSVVGYNDGNGQQSGVNLNTTITDLTQVDTSRVRTTTTSKTRSVFSDFN
jgi:hypothetical protein